MNIKMNMTLKVHLHTLNRNNICIGGNGWPKAFGDCGGGAWWGLGGGGGGERLLSQQKGFTLTHIPFVMTCRDTSKSKLLRGC